MKKTLILLFIIIAFISCEYLRLDIIVKDITITPTDSRIYQGEAATITLSVDYIGNFDSVRLFEARPSVTWSVEEPPSTNYTLHYDGTSTLSSVFEAHTNATPGLYVIKALVQDNNLQANGDTVYIGINVKTN